MTAALAAFKSTLAELEEKRRMAEPWLSGSNHHRFVHVFNGAARDFPLPVVRALVEVAEAAQGHMDGGWGDNLPTCGGYHGDGVACPMALKLRALDKALEAGR